MKLAPKMVRVGFVRKHCRSAPLFAPTIAESLPIPVRSLDRRSGFQSSTRSIFYDSFDKKSNISFDESRDFHSVMGQGRKPSKRRYRFIGTYRVAFRSNRPTSRFRNTIAESACPQIFRSSPFERKIISPKEHKRN